MMMINPLSKGEVKANVRAKAKAKVKVNNDFNNIFNCIDRVEHSQHTDLDLMKRSNHSAPIQCTESHKGHKGQDLHSSYRRMDVLIDQFIQMAFEDPDYAAEFIVRVLNRIILRYLMQVYIYQISWQLMVKQNF